MDQDTHYLGHATQLDLEDLAHRLDHVRVSCALKDTDIVRPAPETNTPSTSTSVAAASTEVDANTDVDSPSSAAPPAGDPQVKLKDLIDQLRVAATDPQKNIVREVFGLNKEGDNAREHKLAEEMSDDIKLTRARKKHRKENRHMLSEALEPDHIVRVPELDISSLLNKDQTRNSHKYPIFKKTTHIPASRGPVCIVDSKDIPIIFVFPKCLAGPSHNIPYQTLIKLGSKIGVKPRDAADQNTRDPLDSYSRMKYEDEIHGVFQLVTLWSAIGRSAKATEPGPALEVIHTVKDYNASLHAMRELNILSSRIDHMFKLIDPMQYDQLRLASDRLKVLYPSYAATANDDITFFHGRSIIFNRQTPEHGDRLDPKLAWTPLVTLGEYTKGTLHAAGLEIDYLPGAVMFIRGGIVKHKVTFEGGQRIAIAHFTHRDLLLKVNVPTLNMCTLNDVRTSLRSAMAHAEESHGGGKDIQGLVGDDPVGKKRKRTRSSSRSVRANASRTATRASSPHPE